MEVEVKEITSRAGLDQRPEEILAMRTKEIVDQINRHVFVQQYVDKAALYYGMKNKEKKKLQRSSFTYLVIGLMLLLVMPKQVDFFAIWWPLTVLIYGIYCVVPIVTKSQLVARFHLWRLERKGFKDLVWNSPAAMEERIRKLEKKREALSLPDAATEFYLQGLEAVREELLGPGSELCNVKEQLEARLKQIRSQVGKLGVRIKSAKREKNVERETQLREAMKEVRTRSMILVARLTRIQSAMDKVGSVIEGCEEFVRGREGSLTDTDLLQQIHASSEADAELAQRVDRVIDDRVEHFQQQLVRIQIAVQVPAGLLSGPEEDIDQYLQRIDRAAEEAAELETSQIRFRKNLSR